MIGERPFITPGPNGTDDAAADQAGAWATSSGSPGPRDASYAPPMGYYIYSGNQCDNINGVNNTTAVIFNNLTNTSCGTGPFYYGKRASVYDLNACKFRIMSGVITRVDRTLPWWYGSVRSTPTPSARRPFPPLQPTPATKLSSDW